MHTQEKGAAQVASGTLSSSSLDRYTCIALAGVAAEYVNFGQAEGGMNDVQQLDSLLKALQVNSRQCCSEPLRHCWVTG